MILLPGIICETRIFTTYCHQLSDKSCDRIRICNDEIYIKNNNSPNPWKKSVANLFIYFQITPNTLFLHVTIQKSWEKLFCRQFCNKHKKRNKQSFLIVCCHNFQPKITSGLYFPFSTILISIEASLLQLMCVQTNEIKWIHYVADESGDWCLVKW